MALNSIYCEPEVDWKKVKPNMGVLKTVPREGQTHLIAFIMTIFCIFIDKYFCELMILKHFVFWKVQKTFLKTRGPTLPLDPPADSSRNVNEEVNFRISYFVDHLTRHHEACPVFNWLHESMFGIQMTVWKLNKECFNRCKSI